MMADPGELLPASGVLPRVRAGTKREALEAICATAAAALSLDASLLLEAVLEREALGGTGVGDGVAIPHARIAGPERVTGFFARLDPPQSFDAHDGKPCDLVFMLVAPLDAGADHLKALALVSRTLRRADLREKLRAAETAQAIRALLRPHPAASAA
jgi:PTS system nitrogen regulatory IIA component